MTHRIPQANDREFWSKRDQVVHRSETTTDETAAHEDDATTSDPGDYSAIGGPDDERAYGRSRSDTGSYPFDRHEGQAERGGYLKATGTGPRTQRRCSPRLPISR